MIEEITNMILIILIMIMVMNLIIEKINLHMEEEYHYEILGITKENAMLKGQIASAIGEFESLLSSFVENQMMHLSRLLDSMSMLLDQMALKFG